jgi:hypothetical protein
MTWLWVLLGSLFACGFLGWSNGRTVPAAGAIFTVGCIVAAALLVVER